MRSSEDNADDEFVFVANKVVTARCFNNSVNLGSSCSATRSPRPHPRLNHLQPIPTTLDIAPTPVPKMLTTLPNTTTSKSKATPLPPELIELLPPHLRENTVPDYSGSSSSISPISRTSRRCRGQEEEGDVQEGDEETAAPERPPLPTAYCPGDYSNLEDPTTPTTGPPASSSSCCSSPHSYAHLSDIVSCDSVGGLSPSQGTRASSLTSSRPNSRNGSVSTLHSASHTAPAALGLTDSGISSCGSSSCSSNSSRSNSSRSLPREGSRTSLNGRPLQPPSPKFARNAASTSSSSHGSSNSLGSNPCLSPPLTKVSYTAVLASDGEKASMYRKLEALTPTPSPLLNNFRANSNPQAAAASRGDLCSAAVESRPHTRHVATAHTTLTAMGQCKSSVSHASTPTPSHTPNHTPTPARKAKTLRNGGVSSTAGADVHKCWNGVGVEGGGGDGFGGGGGGGGGVVSYCSASHQVLSSASSSRHTSPIRSTPIVPTSVTTYSPSPVHSPMGQISDHRAKGWAGSPPSSPEMRRAWNVVGVPVSHCISTPTKGRSPAASPAPSTGYSMMSGSDPDSIYDNLVVRQPPLAPSVSKATPPMASVPPTFTPVAFSASPLPNQHQGPHSSAASSRRITQSPMTPGKPPSPSAQRRATSRSPTPTGAWGGPPGGGVGVGIVNPQYVPYYPSGDGSHYGGCWVPVWGSSPQLYQGDGTPLYPTYVYGGPPGAPPSSPPAGVMCEGRSHSCDRIQVRPSPPPSPRNGRRSASPWRGGSASPQSHRHSPSPDPCSGRPPRPRRPPMRKSKTVEVGFLGVGVGTPATHHLPGGEGVASPLHSTVSYVPSQAPVASNQVFLQHLGHQHHHPMSGSYHAQQRYANQKQQPRVSNFEVIHEQIRNASNGEPTYVNSSPSPSLSPYDDSNRPLTNGGAAHDLVSPSLVSSTYYPSSESVHAAKQGQAEVSKPKGSSLEDRVHRLEGDKDSLQLQVTVLSEQVEAQTEKIQDMESLLDQKKELLRKTEEQLQKEVMTRSSLETQRLELFSEISNLKLRQAAFERENAELRDKIRRVDHQVDHVKAQSVATGVGRSGSGRSITPAAASTPVHSILCSPDSPQPSHQTPPPNARRKIEQFGTIPRQREADLGGAATTGRTKGVMFGKGLHFLPFRVAGKRSTSAPNLAETEMQMIDDLPEGEYCPNVDGIAHPASSSPRMNALAGHRSPTTQHKTTGIKKIFTRLRRSSSGHLESDLGDGDFRRGGMRATASARLGWTSPNTIFKEPSEAFRSWNIETMEAWFGALGLSQYCAAVRTWSVAGRHMSQVTPQQLERDLGIRHPLHRKKIQLAISARVTGDQLNTPLARLDHAWVLRWLDDVGLPQYKDAFSEARIDGRVLNCLTYDDLAFLRLTNLLHVTSLKRGIQVLREHNFDPSVLKRRSLPEEDQRERSPSEVALWTNHRVMEWLRTVDLSEYAPNLRGSGVHGALMVYEVRFTSELLASLLSIPCGKTLLRRHLNTHFKELVGLSIVQEKRELEATAGYTPLTTTAKVKMPKKSQFSLKRKKTKSDLEFDDLLCPLDEKPPSGALQDKEKEVRTGELEEELTDSVKVEKSISTNKETEVRLYVVILKKMKNSKE